MLNCKKNGATLVGAAPSPPQVLAILSLGQPATTLLLAGGVFCFGTDTVWTFRLLSTAMTIERTAKTPNCNVDQNGQCLLNFYYKISGFLI